MSLERQRETEMFCLAKEKGVVKAAVESRGQKQQGEGVVKRVSFVGLILSNLMNIHLPESSWGSTLRLLKYEYSTPGAEGEQTLLHPKISKPSLFFFLNSLP